MNIPMMSSAVGLAVTLGGGGYWVGTELSAKADKHELIAVNTKADVGINEAINYNLTEIQRLDSKFKHGKASEYEKEQLRLLRKKVDDLQKYQQLR